MGVIILKFVHQFESGELQASVFQKGHRREHVDDDSNDTHVDHDNDNGDNNDKNDPNSQGCDSPCANLMHHSASETSTFAKTLQNCTFRQILQICINL